MEYDYGWLCSKHANMGMAVISKIPAWSSIINRHFKLHEHVCLLRTKAPFETDQLKLGILFVDQHLQEQRKSPLSLLEAIHSKYLCRYRGVGVPLKWKGWCHEKLKIIPSRLRFEVLIADNNCSHVNVAVGIIKLWWSCGFKCQLSSSLKKYFN